MPRLEQSCWLQLIRKHKAKRLEVAESGSQGFTGFNRSINVIGCTGEI